MNLLLFLFKQNPYGPYARYFGSYARLLKICEVCNFGAITGSLCERTDCWFRLIWNCSFCKDEGVATFISS